MDFHLIQGSWGAPIFDDIQAVVRNSICDPPKTYVWATVGEIGGGLKSGDKDYDIISRTPHEEVHGHTSLLRTS